MLNRSLIIVKARQPFLDWLHSLPDPADITLEDADWDNTAYLIQDITGEEDHDQILAHYCDMILREQLAGWWMDEGDWPEIKDLKTFKKWFDVEFHSVVRDLVDEPVMDDE